jgi:2-dehydro-3-deoxyphosphogluconate aldolase/(4S)-4-hydroxy-2-oxoglutarate aldolase
MGDASYLKSLLAPIPHLRLITTSGVTLQTVESFLRAGTCALVIGNDLVNLSAIDVGTPETIIQTARVYLSILAQVRADLHQSK